MPRTLSSVTILCLTLAGGAHATEPDRAPAAERVYQKKLRVHQTVGYGDRPSNATPEELHAYYRDKSGECVPEYWALCESAELDGSCPTEVEKAGECVRWERLRASSDTSLIGMTRLHADCDAGNARACLRAGQFYEHKDRPELTAASSMYSLACNRGSGIGCEKIGWFYLNGIGVRDDYERGIAHTQTACELMRDPACALLRKLGEPEWLDDEGDFIDWLE